tara:strand:+ start:1178 stop:1540 length:363 start_codon:yes stop_codon:yes gene_type:complete
MSTLKVNQIQDASGSNGSTAEQIQQGRAKAWVRFNGSGTVSITDSFNVSSMTDHGTGSYEHHFTTNMANANYVAMANAGRFAHCGGSAGSYTTSSFRVAVANLQGNAENRSVIHAIVFGD